MVYLYVSVFLGPEQNANGAINNRNNNQNVPAPVQNNLNNWIRGNNTGNNSIRAGTSTTSFHNTNDRSFQETNTNFTNRVPTDNSRNSSFGK